MKNREMFSASVQGPAAQSVVEEGFVSVAEAARFLSVSRATLYTLMTSGEIMFAKVGRSRRVPRTALRQYAEKCIVGQ